MRRFGRRTTTNRKGVFNPDDTTRVKHTRVGVWDLYEEINPDLQHIPGSSWIEKTLEAYACLPYLARMIRDILSIRSCLVLICSFGVAEMLLSLIPAASLW